MGDSGLSIVIVNMGVDAETKACEQAAREAAPNAEIYITAKAESGIIVAKNEGIQNTTRARILFLTPNLHMTRAAMRLMDIDAEIVGSGAGAVNTSCEGRDIAEYTGAPLEFTACLLVRRRVFEHVGLFDEKIGHGWCEDVDLCWRAADAGLMIRQARETGINGVGASPLDGNQIFNVKLAHEKAHEYMRRKWKNRLLGKSVPVTPAAARPEIQPKPEQPKKEPLKWHDNDKKKILMVCPSYDCAGVAYYLTCAINKYSKQYTARQVVGRVLESFKFKYDIFANEYTIPEWMQFIKEADVIHIHFGLPDEFLGGAIPWRRIAREKRVIWHSHSGWEPGKDQAAIFHSGELQKRIDFVDAVLGCSPVDAAQFAGGKWLPNVLPDNAELAPLPNKQFDRIIVSHSPSNKENKSTHEFNMACLHLRARDFDFDDDVIFGVEYGECLRRKRASHIHFDNMHQGYHGMASFEAMAQGIPSIARVDDSVISAYVDLFGSCQIVSVKNQAQLEAALADLISDSAALKKAGADALAWMKANYTQERIVSLYEAFYAGLDKKPRQKRKDAARRILVLNHRHGDLSWTRGRWIESAIRAAGHDCVVFKNQWKQHTLGEIVRSAGVDFDFILQLGEYSCPHDIAEGHRGDHSLPFVLWTDDSVVWDTFNGKDHTAHFQGLHYQNYLPLYDMVFELFPQSMPLIREFATGPVHLLMHAWEPQAWSAEKRDLKTGVLFCGRYEKAEPEFTGEGWYLRRGRVIDEIRRHGVEVKVFFSHDTAAWTREIQEAKIVLNKSLNFNLNMRFFETLGAGRFLLTDRAHGVDSIFADGKELVCYDSPAHAAELAKYYLKHDVEREKIAAAGRKAVHDGKHTYIDRVKELVAKVEEIL